MTAEVTKVTQSIVIGSSELTVSKVVAFFIVTPGTDSGGTPTTRQAHVYAQKVTR